MMWSCLGVTSFKEVPKISAEDIRYHIITSLTEEQIITSDELKEIEITNFNKNWRTIFVIHGFLSGPSFIKMFRKAYFKDHPETEVNIIGVDWSEFASVCILRYEYASMSTRYVGEVIGDFIESAVEKGLINSDKIQIIGHSLGAHVAGFIGKHINIRNVERCKIGREPINVPLITALDPAKPNFSKNTPDRRLTVGDAKSVEVIHSNGGQLGIYKPIGHTDYYLNKGKRQPCCKTTITGIVQDILFFGMCSHTYAHKWYREIIHLPSIKGWKLESLKEVERVKYKNLPSSSEYFGPEQKRERGLIYIDSHGEMKEDDPKKSLQTDILDIIDVMRENIEISRNRKESIELSIQANEYAHVRRFPHFKFPSPSKLLNLFSSPKERFIVFGINEHNRNNFMRLLSGGNNLYVAYDAREQQYVIVGNCQPNDMFSMCDDIEPARIEQFLGNFRDSVLGYVLAFDYTDLFSDSFWMILQYLAHTHNAPLFSIAMNMIENETSMEDRIEELKEIIQSGIHNFDQIRLEIRKISTLRQTGPLKDHEYLNDDVRNIRELLNEAKANQL